jgi:septal ring factor EnvC (AmiA/AmiB activator)
MVNRPAIARSVNLLVLIALGGATATPATALDLEGVMKAGADKVQLAQASQKTIDTVVQQTDSLETEYKQVMKYLDGLQVYHDNTQRQIEGQVETLAELQRSIERVDSMQRQIMPLMVEMLDALGQFVELDVPFLKDERVARVERLKRLMANHDVSVAEKFRSLMEAFQIENDFGRTIETYKDTLLMNGATLEVNMLRVGRIGLYYQTNDASATGRWDPAAGQWVPLTGGGVRNQVRQGLRIARKQVAPDLLMLEIPAPEVAQ